MFAVVAFIPKDAPRKYLPKLREKTHICTRILSDFYINIPKNKLTVSLFNRDNQEKKQAIP